MRNDMLRRVFAELLETFWLVFGECGSAVLAAAYPQFGIGFLESVSKRSFNVRSGVTAEYLTSARG